MSTKMDEDDWAHTLAVFRACLPRLVGGKLRTIAAGIVNLSVRWAEGRRFSSEVRSGRSACLGDLAPNPEGALARSAAAVGSDGFRIGNVEEIRDLIVNR